MSVDGDALGDAIKSGIDGTEDKTDRQDLFRAMGNAIVDYVGGAFAKIVSGTVSATMAATSVDVTLADSLANKPAVACLAGTAGGEMVQSVQWLATPTRLRITFDGALSTGVDVYYVVDGR